jgi:hypothetical protein
MPAREGIPNEIAARSSSALGIGLPEEREAEPLPITRRANHTEKKGSGTKLRRIPPSFIPNIRRAKNRTRKLHGMSATDDATD